LLQVNDLDLGAGKKTSLESRAGGGREETMDQSMRMVIIAGVLMLALLIAIIGSVSADSVTWNPSMAHAPAGPVGQHL
jgi:hypothetical protein